MGNNINEKSQFGQEAEFNPADIDRTIPDSAYIEMAKLVTAWAKLDALTSQLLYQIVGIPYDMGEILLERMGITGKQSRIMEITGHYGNKELKQMQSEILAMINTHYPVRNTICHSECIGVSIQDYPGSLAFIKSYLIKGLPGRMKVVYFPIETIQTITKFAVSASDRLPAFLAGIAAIQEATYSKTP